MSKPWKKYQEEAASLFQEMGFDTKIEEKISGVRAEHAIDVWVTGKIHNIPFNWVVECKHWKASIPKEKILTLLSIVQDVGADRGFILSENGFQPGAYNASFQTNISLSSLKELHNIVKESIIEDALQNLSWRVLKLKRLVWKAHKRSGDYVSKFMEPMGQLCFLELSIHDAQDKEFPTMYGISEDKKLIAEDMASFINGATDFINDVETASYNLFNDEE